MASLFGFIQSVRHNRVGNDEVEINVTVRNDTDEAKRYFVNVKSLGGRHLDGEPNAIPRSVGAGQSSVFRLSSSFDPLWDFDTVSQGYILELVNQARVVHRYPVRNWENPQVGEGGFIEEEFPGDEGGRFRDFLIEEPKKAPDRAGGFGLAGLGISTILILIIIIYFLLKRK